VTSPWSTFAARRWLNNAWHYERVGGEQWLRICFPRLEVVAVEAVEDPEGHYFAWATPDGNLSMMWPTLAQFSMQFPYGYEALERRGAGRMVRIRVEEA
jgi:hypothetical protein